MRDVGGSVKGGRYEEMDITVLQSGLAGTVVQQGDSEYETVRRAMVWNALKPERRPALIVRVANAADVVTAVRFARAHGLRVSARGGGHNWCGVALRDGGMLIDLTRLNQVAVDPATRRAAVQPIVTNRELARHLAIHKLAFPFGHCSSVPLSGYLLGGGFGWNAGVWGPACFSLHGIDVVTADGRLCSASAEHESELFWAARGAGPGFFGIVTRFHLQLYALPQAITSSTYVFGLERLADVVEWLTDVSHRLSPAVEVALLLSAGPPEVQAQCRSSNGMACTVSAAAFVDTPEAAVTALAPLETSPLARECLWKHSHRPTPFDVLFDDMDRVFPQQHRYVADTVWSSARPAEVIAALRDPVAAAPSPKSLLLCVLPPPAAAGAPPLPDAAFSMAGNLMTLAYAIWDDPEDDAPNRAWHRSVMETLEPFAIGHYIGESDIVATPSRAPHSFAPANWQRLQTLREQYDPDGVFHGFPSEDK